MTAIVLAGGRSSRMGSVKALLPFDGEPLIVHLVRRLHPLFADVIAVAAPGQALPSLPARIVHDAVAHLGPVGGIYYGLQATNDELALVTSCDAVFLSTALVSHLVSLIDGWDSVVPRWDGRPQPLVAVYRRTILPVLESQLAAGKLRMTSLLESVRSRSVEEDEVRRFDPDGSSFFNMNEPQDYELALNRWRSATLG